MWQHGGCIPVRVAAGDNPRGGEPDPLVGLEEEEGEMVHEDQGAGARLPMGDTTEQPLVCHCDVGP